MRCLLHACLLVLTAIVSGCSNGAVRCMHQKKTAVQKAAYPVLVPGEPMACVERAISDLQRNGTFESLNITDLWRAAFVIDAAAKSGNTSMLEVVIQPLIRISNAASREEDIALLCATHKTILLAISVGLPYHEFREHFERFAEFESRTKLNGHLIVLNWIRLQSGQTWHYRCDLPVDFCIGLEDTIFDPKNSFDSVDDILIAAYLASDFIELGSDPHFEAMEFAGMRAQIVRALHSLPSKDCSSLIVELSVVGIVENAHLNIDQFREIYKIDYGISGSATAFDGL